jgi:hypothetical protein
VQAGVIRGKIMLHAAVFPQPRIKTELHGWLPKFLPTIKLEQMGGVH